VPEPVLHGAQIDTALEQMLAKVCQGLWRHALRESGSPRGRLDDGPRADPRQRRPAAFRKGIPRPLPRSSVGRISRLQ